MLMAIARRYVDAMRVDAPDTLRAGAREARAYDDAHGGALDASSVGAWFRALALDGTPEELDAAEAVVVAEYLAGA